jgi:hypothetical protein
MAAVDFIVFVLGVYGLSWLLVFSAIFENIRNHLCKITFLNNLLSCIVCTSVWISAFFIYFYFPAECWYTRLLLIGTTTTATWALANLLGDIE